MAIWGGRWKIELRTAWWIVDHDSIKNEVLIKVAKPRKIVAPPSD